MDCIESILSRRSIRKFRRKEVPADLLRKLVKYASMAASAMNRQPMKYVIVSSDEKAGEVFKLTRWAGYLKGKGSPSWDERPESFILVFNDRELAKEGYELDAGAAIQNILLGANSLGLATCWLGAIDRPAICAIAGTDDRYELIAAVAVGYPNQKSVPEPSEGDIKYYLDEENVLHVPKRRLDEIILNTC
ncbi:MAG: nitroreductase family protein [Clostridia bacterium]|nr:nitroreductase family protein [Clostridia bacterium]